MSTFAMVLSFVLAAVARLAVLAWIEADGREAGAWPTGWPESGGGLIDGRFVVRLPGGTITREPRAAHPLCGCRWPSAA